eukprot:653029-Rhodomonas_salina.1
MPKEELLARRDIQLQHHAGLVDIEANCMVDMAQQQILPALKTAGLTEHVTRTEAAVPELELEMHAFTGAVADEWLGKSGASRSVLDDPSWTKTKADK